MTDPPDPLQRILKPLRTYVPAAGIRSARRSDPQAGPGTCDEATSQVQLDLIQEAFGATAWAATSAPGKDRRLPLPPRPGAVPCAGRRPPRRLLRGAQGRLRRPRADHPASSSATCCPTSCRARRRSGRRRRRTSTLDELDAAARAGRRRGLVRPDHIVYVTPGGIGKLCPATEPDLPLGKGPVPALTQDRRCRLGRPGLGRRHRLVRRAPRPTPSRPGSPATSRATSRRSTRPPSTPYAGHGTFVAGVIRCLAPATDIEIEGVLTKAGAVYESEITEELNEAMRDKDKPDAHLDLGRHLHPQQPRADRVRGPGAAYHRARASEGAVLVVAAAGNDATDRPFYPAAYDWVVSRRRPGRRHARLGLLQLRATGSTSTRTAATWSTRSRPAPTPATSRPTWARCAASPAWPSGAARRSPRRSSPALIAAYMSEHNVSARDAATRSSPPAMPFTDPRQAEHRASDRRSSRPH